MSQIYLLDLQSKTNIRYFCEPVGLYKYGSFALVPTKSTVSVSKLPGGWAFRMVSLGILCSHVNRPVGDETCTQKPLQARITHEHMLTFVITRKDRRLMKSLSRKSKKNCD